MTKEITKSELDELDREMRRELCLAAQKAASVIVSLLDSKDEMVRLEAAIYILNRVLGKPIQPYRFERPKKST